MNTIPVALIFIPILAASTIYLIHRPWISYLVFLTQAVLTGCLTAYTQFLLRVDSHEQIVGNWSNLIGIGLRNDRLSLGFLWLTLLFWWIVLLYSWAYRRKDYKFLFFLMFLEGTFLGLLQSNDAFTLFVFIDITTIISTILIIYEKDGYAIRSGVFYLLFNSVGMLFYQLGFIFLYTSLGSLNFTVLSTRIASYPHAAVLRLSYVFFLVAAGVKSAVFPVYTWLPRAHSAAPSAISALLSGLLVKSGLYAFIRLQHIFAFDYMNDFFFWVGLLSALSGVVFALSQKDLKQMLAYSTVSQIGLIVMGLSQPNTLLYMGGIAHLFNHALFKSLLFLCAGLIIHRTGKRRLQEIRGLLRAMPLLSVAMIIGMLSLSGGFLTNGFMSKSLFSYGLQKKDLLTQIVYQIVNGGTIAYCLKIAPIFFGHAEMKKRPIEIGQKIAVALLAGLCLSIPWFFEDLWMLLGIQMPHIERFSMNKALLLSTQTLLGMLLSWQLLNREPVFIRRIRHFHIGFGASNALMLLFLILMILSAKLY